MRFIDEVRIEVIAGHGGAGCVSFRREKYIPRGGPDGGNGGRGGHVIFFADTSRNTLLELHLRKRLLAKNGKTGMGANRHGRNGADIVLPVPVGTIVKDEDGCVIADLDVAGKRLVIANGGRGGLGNKNFASSVNQSPRYSQPGEDGEYGVRLLELKVMADVGLLGLPNAGKSTLLARVSNARPKIADYPFTTLVPQPGLVICDDNDAFVMADIPGLIAGAHTGKGLGYRFLRHVERTRVLLHLIDVACGVPIAAQLDEIEQELRGYGDVLMQKPRLLVLTKIDALDEEELASAKQEVKNCNLDLQTHYISAVSGIGINTLLHACRDYLAK
ncbi:MAG: GTPase ObgE [Mariprofundales bacterium]